MQAVAAEADAAVVEVTGASVARAYLGESERRLRELFAEAEVEAQRGRIAVVFIDEIDALCPRRGSGSSLEARLTAQLLTLLDGSSSSDLVRCMFLLRTRRYCTSLFKLGCCVSC
jgi:SpoVK/Ycf46/Vps4 family AAA+-type ATPase